MPNESCAALAARICSVLEVCSARRDGARRRVSGSPAAGSAKSRRNAAKPRNFRHLRERGAYLTRLCKPRKRRLVFVSSGVRSQVLQAVWSTGI